MARAMVSRKATPASQNECGSSMRFTMPGAVRARATTGTRCRDLFPAGAARPACRPAAGPGETSVLRSARGITGLEASAAWLCPGRRDP